MEQIKQKKAPESILPLSPSMPFASISSVKDWARYSRVVHDSLGVASPLELFSWLQGELQYFLPHEILIAAWGDFAAGNIRYDMVSLPQETMRPTTPGEMVTLLQKLHGRWIAFRRSPFGINFPESLALALSGKSGEAALAQPLPGVRSTLVHGIHDERTQQDCLYVTMHSDRDTPAGSRKMLEILLPYIDTALRRVSPLPQKYKNTKKLAAVPDSGPTDALSNRESEILDWVRQGKTNQEIGLILSISAYTVKNHLQRIFRKLNVYNRAQAVGKLSSANGSQQGNFLNG